MSVLTSRLSCFPFHNLSFPAKTLCMTYIKFSISVEIDCKNTLFLYFVYLQEMKISTILKWHTPLYPSIHLLSCNWIRLSRLFQTSFSSAMFSSSFCRIPGCSQFKLRVLSHMEQTSKPLGRCHEEGIHIIKLHQLDPFNAKHLTSLSDLLTLSVTFTGLTALTENSPCSFLQWHS